MINTRYLRRGDVVLTWSVGSGERVHRAITEHPGSHLNPQWRTVASNTPLNRPGYATRIVHFTDGSTATVPTTADWIDQHEKDIP